MYAYILSYILVGLVEGWGGAQNIFELHVQHAHVHPMFTTVGDVQLVCAIKSTFLCMYM